MEGKVSDWTAAGQGKAAGTSPCACEQGAASAVVVVARQNDAGESSHKVKRVLPSRRGFDSVVHVAGRTDRHPPLKHQARHVHKQVRKVPVQGVGCVECGVCVRPDWNNKNTRQAGVRAMRVVAKTLKR